MARPIIQLMDLCVACMRSHSESKMDRCDRRFSLVVFCFLLFYTYDVHLQVVGEKEVDTF